MPYARTSTHRSGTGKTPTLPVATVFHAALFVVAGLASSYAEASASSMMPQESQDLGAPEAVFPEDFGFVSVVRELSDGRVLVADPFGKALYVVDMDEGERTVVGRLGEGPEEYLQPDAVWELPGDSTLLVDLGNNRLVRIGPDFGFGETHPITSGMPGAGMTMATPQAIDGAGGIYFTSVEFGTPRPDSGRILRSGSGGATIDTVATYVLGRVSVTESGGANNRNVSVGPVPYSPEDAWGIASDGSVVIARANEYQVEWIAPDGSITLGESIPYDPIGLGTAEKREYFTEQGRGGGMSLSATNVNGVIQMAVARGVPGLNDDGPDLDQYEWPEYKPAVYRGRVPVDPRNRAWVRRHVEAGEASVYDVFDRAGRRVATFDMGSQRTIVGFGPASLYAITFDDFDLVFLERYTLPDT